ncbi:NAD-dependent DNA ligase LigA [Buchnera aphidicola]|uniref:NAD-dependent DNA ligase LigA n=1 Tax=Buchnera aphidicola TaxID=9 RepID=UPI0031B85F65
MKYTKKNFFKLKLLLQYHDYLYYVLSEPVISDEEYDFLFHQFQLLYKKYFQFHDYENINHKKLLKKNILTFNTHIYPMLSLNHSFKINGFINFYKKIFDFFYDQKKVNLFCELKFDGVALSLLYKNGKLIRALTRGNGHVGEDVTYNAYFINNIPHYLDGSSVPELLEVRGEVCMLKKDFHILNLNSIKKNKKIFSNARNAASGSLLQKNFLVTKKRNLYFFCYDCIIISGKNFFELHSEQLQMLCEFGFVISPYIFSSSDINKIIRFYYLMEKIRNFVSFDFDGIVVKVDSINLREKIGYTNAFPKWALAIKFFSKTAHSKLLNVRFLVGRTGVITPVADIFPTLLYGSIIKKSSLYNVNEIKKLDLYINDTVVISKIGDVIPKIISVIYSNRSLNTVSKICIPKNCPSCHSLLHTDNNTVLQCLAGINCLEQRKKIIKHFFSKDGLYVRGFSIGIIEKLVNFRFIKTPLDCLTINFLDLHKLKYFGKKLVWNIAQEINKCKFTTLNRLIYALNIPDIGKESSILIANYFVSLKNFLNCTFQELMNIKNIGFASANSIFEFLRHKSNLKNIYQLCNKGGITLLYDNKIMKRNYNSFFLNKNFSITGKFKNFSREMLVNKIQFNGGFFFSHISKKIHYLICGRNPGKKFIQAKNKKIIIILEDEIKKILYK